MASPTKGNTTSANPTPANNFYQFNHNQNSGDDRLIVFQLTMANTTYPTTATYGGQTMVRLYSTNRGGLSQRMAFYYLIDPPTGVNTLRVNFNANQWNPISLPMRALGSSGCREIFVPNAKVGQKYKYRVLGADGVMREKTDPFGSKFDPPLPPPRFNPVRLFLNTCSKARNLRIDWLTEGWKRRPPLYGPIALFI